MSLSFSLSLSLSLSLFPSHHQVTALDSGGACAVMDGVTLVVVGDSFMRHIYISLLELLRAGTPHGALRANTPIGNTSTNS